MTRGTVDPHLPQPRSAAGARDVRVNIGCGATPTVGWANLDNSFTIKLARWTMAIRLLAKVRILDTQSCAFAEIVNQKNIRFANATRRIPYANDSVEVVYSSHMIEHLDRREATAFLHEVRRVLRPGGVVRLAAPDLNQIVTEYLATGDADRLIERSHMGQQRPRGLLSRMKLALIGPRGHLWMYDGHSLTALLLDNGFADARVMTAGMTRIGNPERLDLAERSEESVYVEAVRPPG